MLERVHTVMLASRFVPQTQRLQQDKDMTTTSPTSNAAYEEGKHIGETKGPLAFLVGNPYPYIDQKDAHEQWAKGVAVGLGAMDAEGNPTCIYCGKKLTEERCPCAKEELKRLTDDLKKELDK